MTVFETFSKRQKKFKQEKKLDIYSYDTLPQPFRVQIVYIWVESIGGYNSDIFAYRENKLSNTYWHEILRIIAEEKSLFNLGNPNDNPYIQCKNYLLNSKTTDALDILDLTFAYIDKVLRHLNPYEREQAGIRLEPDLAIEKLNYRFEEHQLGYEFIEGQLILRNNKYIHKEAIVPAIKLLHEEMFFGPSEEFLRAHEHYRKGRYKEAIVEALKAFESTIKSICETRNWPYDPTAQASGLIKVIFEKELIPSYLQSEFTALKSVMECALPTLRNKSSAHGQGKVVKDVPDYFASFALHLAASNIVFLVEAHKAMK